MKPEEQRVAIAKACGWHEKKEPEGSVNRTAWWHNNDRYPSNLMPVPDYLNDLNAMHEAVRSLSEIQLQQYGKELCWVCGIDMNERAFLAPEVFLATSKQCAEAFLRTLNLWTDDT